MFGSLHTSGKRKRSEELDTVSPVPPKLARTASGGSQLQPQTSPSVAAPNQQAAGVMFAQGQQGHNGAVQQQQQQAPQRTTEETKQKYLHIQAVLKAEINQYGPNHPRGIEAMKKLEQFNQQMTQLKNQQQAAFRQAAAGGVQSH